MQKPPTTTSPENARPWQVAIVSEESKVYDVVYCETWASALLVAKQARREFAGMLVFMGDVQHVWRIEELV